MDHHARSALNYFASSSIHRATDKRRNQAWISERLQGATSLFLPMWDLKNLFTEGDPPHAVLLPTRVASGLMTTAQTIVFLGEEDERAYFALDLVSDGGAAPPDTLVRHGEFHDLRRMSGLVDRREGALLAYARALVYWHRRNRFCGDCGSPAASTEGGHSRLCTNPACGQQRFPRTDPAIIVLVTDADHCLLARQAAWPKGMYSTLAGFVEPGESLEDAVIREVMEESSVEVEAVHYHSSQPWPFPCSIMLGFTAHAVRRQIHLADNELEDALWLSRDELQHRIITGAIRVPSPIAIAHRLIEDWFDDSGPTKLKDILEAAP